MNITPKTNELLCLIDELIKSGELRIIISEDNTCYLEMTNEKNSDAIELNSEPARKSIYGLLFTKFNFAVNNASLSQIIQHIDYTVDIEQPKQTIFKRVGIVNGNYIIKVKRNSNSYISISKDRVRLKQSTKGIFNLPANSNPLPNLTKKMLMNNDLSTLYRTLNYATFFITS